MIIKLLLLAALGFAVFRLLRGRRSALGLLMRRSLTLLTIVAGAFAVLVPNAVTDVAQFVGVGRGTDLVVYVLCIAFLFVTIALYQRLKALDDRFVELARRHALLEATLSLRDERSLTSPTLGDHRA